MAIITAAQVEAELGLDPGDYSTVISNAIIKATGAVKRYLRYDPEQKSHTEFYPMQDFDYLGRASVWEVEGSEAVLRRMTEVAVDELQLRHLPIRGGTAPTVSVDYDGRSGTSSGAFATSQTEGTDFWANYDLHDSSSNRVCSDGILRAVGSWPTTPGSVKVVYTAGYSASELAGSDSVIDASPIWDAVLTEAIRRVRVTLTLQKTAVGVLAGPLKGERLGDYNYQVDTEYIKKVGTGSADLLPETRMALNDYVNWGWMLAS